MENERRKRRKNEKQESKKRKKHRQMHLGKTPKHMSHHSFFSHISLSNHLSLSLPIISPLSILFDFFNHINSTLLETFSLLRIVSNVFHHSTRRQSKALFPNTQRALINPFTSLRGNEKEQSHVEKSAHVGSHDPHKMEK